MDKDFKQINDIYLNQAFDGRAENEVLEECKQIAKAYALAENAIVSMGNNIENCSYCYFGGLADVLGIPIEEQKETISSSTPKIRRLLKSTLKTKLCIFCIG